MINFEEKYKPAYHLMRSCISSPILFALVSKSCRIYSEGPQYNTRFTCIPTSRVQTPPDNLFPFSFTSLFKQKSSSSSPEDAKSSLHLHLHSLTLPSYVTRERSDTGRRDTSAMKTHSLADFTHPTVLTVEPGVQKTFVYANRKYVTL